MGRWTPITETLVLGSVPLAVLMLFLVGLRHPRVLPVHRVIHAGAGAVFCTWLATIVVKFVTLRLHVGIPTLPWFACVVWLTARGLCSQRMGCRDLQPQERATAAVALACTWPVLFLAAHESLSVPIAGVPSMHTMHVGFTGTDAIAWCLAGSWVVALIGWCYPLTAIHGRHRRWIDRMLAKSAPAFVLLAAVALMFAWVRAAARPDPDDYLESLPVVARLPAASTWDRYIAVNVDSGTTVTFVRDHRSVCLAPRDWSPEQAVEERACRSGSAYLSDPAGDTLRHDPRFGLWLLGAITPHQPQIMAYRGKLPYPQARRRRGLHVWHVSEALSAPRWWLVGATLGLLFALLELAWRRRAVTRLRRLDTARRGQVTADGAIEFDDGELPARGHPTTAVPEGPATATPVTPTELPSYRDDGTRGPWLVSSGTVEAQRATLHARIAAHDAFAVAAVTLTMAPVMAAATAGLVF